MHKGEKIFKIQKIQNQKGQARVWPLVLAL